MPHANTVGMILRPLLARRAIAAALALLLLAASLGMYACAPQTVSVGDEVFASAFAEQSSDVQVTGSGTVTRMLADDNEGDRHQRFIIELESGQTLLISHNIDVAPRIDALAVGDTVEFCGVYEYNPEGGVVHWTHHDPGRTHEPGWIDHDGRRYE